MSSAETSTGLKSNQAYLEPLFRQYQRQLIHYLRRVVSDEDTAADLAQETYLRLASVPAAQRISYPRAFLFRTALNLAFDYVRRRKTQRALASPGNLAATLPTPQDSPEQAVFDRQRLALFRQTLEALPPRCREVFILHKVKGLSYAEIAARLGVSQSAVEKHLMRALARCRSALQEQQTE